MLLLTLLILGTFRISRFVALDTFPPMAWVRDRVRYKRTVAIVKTPEGGRKKIVVTDERGAWAELVACPHCVGVYVAYALTLVVNYWVSIPLVALVALAVAGGQSLLASVAAGLERD